VTVEQTMKSGQDDPTEVSLGNNQNLKKRRVGIFLLPNLLTTGALFAGFYSIVAAINGRFEAAAISVLVAMLLDGMDGRIARMTNTQSDFGAQYDSLSDMVSFGLAPALIMYQWILFQLGNIGWLAAFLYSAATGLRLSRFNTQASSSDKRFFQGLPSPAAAAFISSYLWFGESFAFRDKTFSVGIAVFITVGAALLMISNIRYHSFKELDLKGRVSFIRASAIVGMFALISIQPESVLLLVFATYVLSGLVETSMSRHRKRSQRERRT